MRKIPSLAGRAMLAIVLMVGFYVLALGLCALLGLLIWHNMQSERVSGRLVLFAAITIGIVLWSTFPRRLTFPDPGVPLRSERQPDLWRLICSVAQAAGQPPPKQVFLVGDVNAFVAERGSWLGFGGSRIMGIGLPLLQVLTVPQLRSVLAHEFGHFCGGDTRLGPFVYRTREAIGRTITNFQKADSLLQLPFQWYGKLFLRVTHAISRAQEFAADALAVRLVGLAPTQTALRRVNEVGPLFEHYLQSEFLPLLNQGVRPPLAGGFGLFLQSAAMSEAQLEVGEQAMQAKGNPYDTHPPLSQRLAAAAEVPDAAARPSHGPLAVSLLHELSALELELLLFMTKAPSVRQLRTGQWPDLLPAHLLANWRAFATAHAAKFPSMRVRDLAAARPELPRMAIAVDGKCPPGERIAAGATMFGILLALALHRAGWALEAAPGDPVALRLGNHRILPIQRTRALAGGKFDAAEWSAVCIAAGIGDLVLSGPEAVPPPA